jgi:hypothetical protein
VPRTWRSSGIQFARAGYPKAPGHVPVRFWVEHGRGNIPRDGSIEAGDEHCPSPVSELPAGHGSRKASSGDFPHHGRCCGLWPRWHWTVNLGPRSLDRIDAVMSDEGNTDATVDEAKMACCERRKAGQRRHGDSEVGKSGSESSHPVRDVREAAGQQGSRAGHHDSRAWWCRGLGKGGWLFLFSRSLVALLASTPHPPHCRSLFVLHKPQQRFVRVT